jgi:hypothetical protein
VTDNSLPETTPTTSMHRQATLHALACALVATVVLAGCSAAPASPPTSQPIAVEPTSTPPAVAEPASGSQPMLPLTSSAPTAWAPSPRSKTAACVSQGGLPDPECNPGAIDPRVSQANIATTICVSGYTAKVRPAVSLTDRIKGQQMAAYGLEGKRLADYELDHLVSLEVGGAPADVANLWPEPWYGNNSAHQKDAVENYLHEQVCRGAMQLVDAQRQIATNWTAVYRGRGLQPAP